MELINTFKLALQTKTLKDSFVTTSGTVINGVLGILFYILVARSLGSENFGIFTIAVATITILADIGSLGIDTGIIRFISKYLNGKYKLFLKLGLEIKILVWLTVAIFGWLIAPILAQSFFGKSELVQPLRMSLLGAGGAMFFSFIATSFQGLQKYWVWSAFNITSNSIRLVLILLLSLTVGLTLENTLIIYIVIPFIFFFLGLFLLPNFLVEKNEQSVIKEFFKFNRWMILLTIVAALGARVDTFMAAKFLSIGQVGLYGVALQVAGVLPQLIFALAAVVAPKFASFNTRSQAWNYFKKVELLVLGLAFLGILLIPVANLLIPLIYGSVFEGSVRAFTILFIAQLLFLLSVPAHQSIFYYFAKPQVFVIFSIINLLMVIFLSIKLIPLWGIEGAAATVLVGNILNFILPTFWAVKEFARKT
ncbi:MAG: oligosaccharide flippase family protein [Candidatus Daviesbacteria bacterium]|nr:MAG: oligosaccharide flippase family protein [Candidatus Daviesbacteria bacterium]